MSSPAKAEMANSRKRNITTTSSLRCVASSSHRERSSADNTAHAGEPLLVPGAEEVGDLYAI
jgi:hypothetical protein